MGGVRRFTLGLLSLLSAACARSSPTTDGSALPGDGAGMAGDGATEAAGAATPLVIVQNQAPATRDCLITTAVTDKGSERGTYDVALDRDYPYQLYPLLHHRPAGGASPGSVMVTSWSVRVLGPTELATPWPATCPGEFEYPAIVNLAPGEHASAVVQGLRPCHGEVLRQHFKEGRLTASHAAATLVRLQVRARGRLPGGVPIESDWFERAVRVCYGCLQVGYPDPAYADYQFPRVPLCAQLTANPYPGNPCNPAQEPGPVLCCAGDPEGKQLQCPAPARRP
jgi:hypothetical protein